MLRDLGFQFCPVPTPRLRFGIPEVKLQLTLACWRTLESLIRTFSPRSWLSIL